MNTFQIGDIAKGNNSWLNSMLGYCGQPGVIIHVGSHSSIIHLFILKQDITLMNDYIDKLILEKDNENLQIGDLVELKPEVLDILNINGIGTIIDKTIIRTKDFDDKTSYDIIHAFLVYFPEMNCEYTIPCCCLRVFSDLKND